MAFRIELIETKNEWENVLRTSKSTIFHHWDWLEAFASVSGYRFEPYLIYHEKTPIGILPIFTIRKYGLNFRFSPPPHSAIPFLGFTFSEFEVIKQNKKEMYIRETYRVIRNLINDSTLFNMTLTPSINDVRPFLWNNHKVKPIYHYVFNLNLGEENLWMNLKKHLRKNIKKASENIEIKEGGRKELGIILNFTKRRYEEQGKKVKVPDKYIFEVYRKFRNNFQILTAELEGEIVGGMVNLLHKDEVYSWLGNTKTDLQGIYPNDLLIWDSIRRACQNGFRLFYEIGANTPRLVKYKAGFNPELVICFSILHESQIGKIARKIYNTFSNHGVIKN